MIGLAPLAVTGMVQVAPVVEVQPVQVAVEPPLGLAVRVTLVPTLKAANVVPEIVPEVTVALIPEGFELTVPLPLPAVDTAMVPVVEPEVKAIA